MARKLEEANKKRQERLSKGKKKSGKKSKKVEEKVVAPEFSGQDDTGVLSDDSSKVVEQDDSQLRIAEDLPPVNTKKKIALIVQTDGGMVHKRSCNSLISLAMDDDIEIYMFFYNAKEGFCKAMNEVSTIAAVSGLDKVLHVTSGMSFDLNNIKRVINSDKKIIGAACPKGGLPVEIDFTPNKNDMEFFGEGNSIGALKKAADSRGEDGYLLVDAVSDSFVCIDVSLLNYFLSVGSKYIQESYIFNDNGLTLVMDAFGPYTSGGSKLFGIKAFCKKCLDLNVEIYLDTDSILSDVFLIR